jgi:hypothetical protein
VFIFADRFVRLTWFFSEEIMKKNIIFSLICALMVVGAYSYYVSGRQLDYNSVIPLPVASFRDYMNFEDNNIRIYEVYHKPAPFFSSNIVIPVHAGKALNNPAAKSLDMLMPGDDTGDNISLKNKTFAELTVMYWMWKNSKAKYVGLMHYRRSFVIRGNTFDCQDYLCSIGLNMKNVAKLLLQYDIILPKKSFVIPSIYQHYLDNHFKEDIDMALDYIRQHYPEMKDDIEPALYVTEGYYGNMFIMKKQILNEYAAWLFEILFALEDKLDYSQRFNKTWGKFTMDTNQYQLRAPAYLSERLFNVWIHHNRDKYRIGELDVVIR